MTADPDVYASASISNMVESLAGSLRGGAVKTGLPIPASGTVDVDWETREPLVLVAPRISLPGGVRLDVTVGGGPDAVFAQPLFVSRTEAGAAIPIHRPAADPSTSMAAPFSLTVSATHLNADGTPGAVMGGTELSATFHLVLIEGVFGRLLYALAAEKARIRRCGRDVGAMRRLSSAQLVALDRIGADLGVPRFTDAIRYDPTTKQILASFDPSGNPIVETDDDYRARLGIYNRFVAPSRTAMLALLNGTGGAAQPNAGPIAELGFTPRFTIEESDEPFAMTLALVEVGSAGYRANFLQYVRQAFLVWIEDSPAADAAHAGRFRSTEEKTATDALRARLRAAYAFPSQAAVAPLLAQALDQLAAVYAALGGTGKLAIQRAQDGSGGSRYELGLGVDLAPLPAAELDALAAKVNDPHRTPAADTGVESVVRSMTPAASSRDPDGAWFLSACGLQTVFRIDPGNLYLSHLPVDGLVIDGPASVATGAIATFETRYETPGSPNENAALSAAVAAAAAAWSAAGHTAWTPLDATTAQNDWTHAPARAAADPALGVFRAAGLPALEAPASVAPQLAALPAAMLTTLRLDVPFAAAVVAGESSAITELAALVAVLRGAGFTSVLPMLDAAGELLLIVSVIGLPVAGLNLNERRASGFLWYALPIQNDVGALFGTMGSTSSLRAQKPGLFALAVVGFARRDTVGPYEYRVDLPDKAVLSVRQYEFVMNVLASVFPIGVMVNTYGIRSGHVDLDGDGVADPLPPTLARTYRDFQRTRYRGQSAMGLT